MKTKYKINNVWMKINLFFILGGVLLLSSCSPKISSSIQKTYDPLDYRQEVRVFGVDEEAPADGEKLGSIKIGDTGFSTNCNYDIVIEKAKEEARKVGGNAFKITSHTLPDFVSQCHRITADVYRVENIEKYAAQSNTTELDQALLDEGCAIINVYRSGGQGFLVSYDLYLGDSIICRVSNNFCESIKIDKRGMNTLWAKTESKEEVPINIESGKVYYVRCSIGVGVLVGRPRIEIVDSANGKREFETIQNKKKD